MHQITATFVYTEVIARSLGAPHRSAASGRDPRMRRRDDPNP
jgi:hypothetical protein